MLENKKKETSIRQFLEESSERSSLEQRGVFESTVARIEVAFDWLMKVLDESNGPKGLTTTEIVEHYEGKGSKIIIFAWAFLSASKPSINPLLL